jgi:hypothetical protein
MAHIDRWTAESHSDICGAGFVEGFCEKAGCWLATAVRGESRSRSEVVALVREVLWVTAVHPANCGEGYGRARYRSRPK